jgi:hypothetical protein
MHGSMSDQGDRENRRSSAAKEVPPTRKDPFNNDTAFAVQRCGEGRAMKQLAAAEGVLCG